ncbi:8-amino-7-oxononanoate synthase [Franzmannia pantelleriensis]|uniref:8-amino-7-oxononanoate synthase n=1 Tax=Franzmannia pantelleriensis TaxID=48727 RepID=A0A1G9VLT9_9GAMM|nr:8-amino-7-oxononanoate synthase [Halomonas pantelleriensis]SDM73202.1 8-amino-7-oxononanoate synthase [Halomonas pantelleriensis]
MWQRLERRLADQRQRGLWRQRAGGTAECIDFAGNDYLGLAHHLRLADAQAAAARRLGAGSGASHLVSGHRDVHEALEQRLATLVGRPRALLFSTGYMANLAVMQTLCNTQTRLFQDRLNHASLLDGAALSGARSRRFHHRDLDDLTRLLARRPAGSDALIVSDGVFSMDGDVADIRGLAALAQRHAATLMIDDAHGIGVLGEHGDGCVGHAVGCDQVPILVGTLGKALGSFGAFVAGDATLIEALIQFARPYCYTTALPPGVAAASLAALDIVDAEPERRARLSTNIALFRRLARNASLPLLDSHTPIQPLLLSEPARALAWQATLAAHGYQVGAIRPPTVPAGTARLRITLSASHTPAMIEQLVATLNVCQQREPDARCHA